MIGEDAALPISGSAMALCPRWRRANLLGASCACQPPVKPSESPEGNGAYRRRMVPYGRMSGIRRQACMAVRGVPEPPNSPTWQHLTAYVDTPGDVTTGRLAIEKGTRETSITGTIRMDDIELELLDSPCSP